MDLDLTFPYTAARLPTFSQLELIAARQGVTFQGDPAQGRYQGRGVEGRYQFEPERITGTFAGYGVRGEFAWGREQLRFSVSDKPFFVPESFVRAQVAAGFDALCRELAAG
jgi:hypothetical protein